MLLVAHALMGRLLWRPLPGPGKMEELPLYRVARVCPGGMPYTDAASVRRDDWGANGVGCIVLVLALAGSLELVLLSLSGQKLLELTAESSAIRELWMQTLEELCACGTSDSSSRTSKTDASDLDELARQEEKQKEVRTWTSAMWTRVLHSRSD